MKALKLDIHFRLPDNFTGDLNDAIEELLKYRRKKDKGHTTIFEIDKDKSMYDNWWDMVNTSDRVFLGEVWLAELKDNNWEFKNDLTI